MDRQFKAFPYFSMKAASDGRKRRGICAVFGNIDSCGDRIMPGAFAKTIQEGRSRVRHLWQHDFSSPPIASITELKEVGRDELPEEVLAFAPEATGGLLVEREYYKDEFSSRILQAIDTGDINEMSFGFDIINYEERKEGTDDNPRFIRELKELKLYDTSDVNWGMNGATVAAGAKTALPIGVVVQHLQMFTDEIKSGRRNAGSDEALINAIHRAALDLGCTECSGIKEEEEKAEAATSTSLEFLKLKTQRLQLAAKSPLGE